MTISGGKKLRLGSQDWAACLGYAGYAAGSAAIPMILLPMSRELGFTLTSGGGLHLIRSVLMVLSMSLAGLAAHRFGKRNVLGCALLMIACGMVVCGIAPSYVFLLLALLLAGFGNGLFESLATGYVQDCHLPEDAGRYITLLHSFWPLGILITGLCAGTWLENHLNWHWIPFAIAAFLLVPAVWLIAKRQPQSKAALSHMNSKQILELMKSPHFLMFLAALFLAGGSEHCITFWTPSYMATEFSNGDGFLSGSAVAVFVTGMFIGRAGTSVLCHLRPERLIIGSAVVGAVLALMMPGIHSPWILLALLLVLGMATGPLWPSLQYCCVSSIKEVDSTLLYILMPLFGIPGCGVCTFLLGLIAEHFGLRSSFCLVFVCNMSIAVLLALHMKLNTNKEMKYELQKS